MSDEEERLMLLSVHPRHAAAILAGTKTVELRRQRVAVPPHTPMIIYATTPQQAIVGSTTVTGVDIAAPRQIWAQHRRSTGITRKEYNTYMDGAALASAVKVSGAHTLQTPIPLSHLRSAGHFQPPQSYRYIGPKELWQLIAGHSSADELMTHINRATERI